MKKIILIITAMFLSMSLYAQEQIDTTILKNGYFYKVYYTKGSTTAVLKNETTFQKLHEANQNTSKEGIEKEMSRCMKYMNADATNFQKYLLEATKDLFNTARYRAYMHKSSIVSRVSLSANGEIINVSFLINKELIDILGYDKLIEYEIKVRKEYKVPPFANQSIKTLSIIYGRVDRDKLNSLYNPLYINNF